MGGAKKSHGNLQINRSSQYSLSTLLQASNKVAPIRAAIMPNYAAFQCVDL
jgi:hypothetical protein